MTPKDIADSRLARGEISLEEHRKILEQLSPDSTVNRRFSASSDGSNVAPPPGAIPPAVPRPPPAASGPTPHAGGSPVKNYHVILGGLGSLVFFLALLTLFLKNQDMNSIRQICDRELSGGTNCQCLETKIRDEASILWYVPILKTLTRPPAAEFDRLFARVRTQCLR